MSADKLSKAAGIALAYLHITGKMPKYIRIATFSAVYGRCNSVPFDINNLSGPDYVVKPEHVAAVESHPMVRKVRELEAAGWTVSKKLGRRKASGGITLTRPSTGTREAETYVWTDGKQSRVWGEPKNDVASLTS